MATQFITLTVGHTLLTINVKHIVSVSYTDNIIKISMIDGKDQRFECNKEMYSKFMNDINDITKKLNSNHR